MFSLTSKYIFVIDESYVFFTGRETNFKCDSLNTIRLFDLAYGLASIVKQSDAHVTSTRHIATKPRTYPLHITIVLKVFKRV
jgi:hypothetical protein